MQKTILDLTQLSQIVFDNRYPVDPKTKFLSRCIDGRYPTSPRLRGTSESQLPVLAFPGADAGEMALILATAQAYALHADRELVFDTLVEIVGGEKNLQFHTDSHGEGSQVLAGCGHIKQINLTPKDYGLSQEDLDFTIEKFQTARKNGAQETVLQGDHGERAVVYVEGNYGIYPQYKLKLDNGSLADVQIFEYHKTLINERHRALSSALLHKEAIILPKDTSEEYLYQALSEMADTQTLETVKRLATGLPIYLVKFSPDGNFEIKELGKVN